jgi:hypothetical protein
VDLLLHTSGGTLAAVSQALASTLLVAASFSSFNPAPDVLHSQCLELPTPRAITCACMTRPDQTHLFDFEALPIPDSKLSIYSIGVSRGRRAIDLPCDTVSTAIRLISQVRMR